MKRFLNETTLLRSIIIIPILGIIITSVILTNIFINTQKELIQNEIDSLKSEYVSNLKQQIQSRIDRIISIIESNHMNNLQKSQHEIKSIVDEAYAIVESNYKQYHHLGKEVVLQKIKAQLRPLRYFEDRSGYIFMNAIDGTALLNPIKPELEGINMLDFTDATGKPIIQEAIKIAFSPSSEGVFNWSFLKTEDAISYENPKIGYVKAFHPLKIFLGSAKYKSEVIKTTKEEFLQTLRSMPESLDDYIFLLDKKGNVYHHINKSFIGNIIDKVDPQERTIILDIIKTAREYDRGGFLQYTPSSTNISKTIKSTKISYVRGVEYFDWIIGTGGYMLTLQKKIQQKSFQLERSLNKAIENILLTSFIVTTLLIMIMLIINAKLRTIFQRYSQQLATSNDSLQKLNDSLEVRIKQEVEENRKKDEILHHSSKLAAMGEMLGNIAHQWRQPLSAISTGASGLKMQKEFNILEDAVLEKELDNIVNNTQMLSQTIEDFRNFFNVNKKKESFELNGTIEKVLKLISANLKNKEIVIIKEIEPLTLVHCENELIQVVLNLVNNAKDVLVQKPKKEARLLFIKAFKKDEQIIIEVRDNGGGIDEKIKHKIFEPYFTTKFNAQGTGIGLYMAKEIMRRTFLGELLAKNVEYNYEETAQKGALFIIKFPQKIKEA